MLDARLSTRATQRGLRAHDGTRDHVGAADREYRSASFPARLVFRSMHTEFVNLARGAIALQGRPTLQSTRQPSPLGAATAASDRMPIDEIFDIRAEESSTPAWPGQELQPDCTHSSAVVSLQASITVHRYSSAPSSPRRRRNGHPSPLPRHRNRRDARGARRRRPAVLLNVAALPPALGVPSDSRPTGSAKNCARACCRSDRAAMRSLLSLRAIRSLIESALFVYARAIPSPACRA